MPSICARILFQSLAATEPSTNPMVLEIATSVTARAGSKGSTRSIGLMKYIQKKKSRNDCPQPKATSNDHDRCRPPIIAAVTRPIIVVLSFSNVPPFRFRDQVDDGS